MRALVLIVICLFLLVALQASYLVIEARHPGKTKTRATEGNEQLEPDQNSIHLNKPPEERPERPNGQQANTMISEKDGESVVRSDTVTLAMMAMKDTSNRNIPIINVTIKHTDISKSRDNMDVYDQMLGDAPALEPRNHGHRKSMKKRNRTKHLKNSGGTEGHRKGKNNRAHDAPTQLCEQDKDCGEGKCCVITRKGQQVCKDGSFKSIGRRCLSSCICKDDLQCYINENHIYKKKYSSKHLPFGHCVDPKKAKLKTGYTPIEDGESTPIPTTTNG